MKKNYRRNAFYIDENILLHGYKDKMGFHPDKDIGCGFDLQRIKTKDVGTKLFYSLKEAIEKYPNMELAGGRIIVAIDDGMVITKMQYRIEDIEGYYMTDKIVSKENIIELITECIQSLGINGLQHTNIKYMLLSDSQSLIYNSIISNQQLDTV